MSQAAVDAREVQLRYTIENSFKTVDATNIWKLIEVNEWNDFGPTYKKVARAPFRSDRQRSKSVIVGQDLTGGFTVDLLQNQHQELMAEMFHAAYREKPTTEAVTISTEIESVSATAYVKTSGSWITEGYKVGHLVYATGFDDGTGTYSANNGLKEVTAVSATDLTVVETLTVQVAAAIPLSAKGVRGAHITAVGFEFAAGDLDVVTAGDFVSLVLTTGVWDDTDLIPAEWFHIADGTTAAPTFDFDEPENNGWKQVRSISADDKTLVVNKSQNAMSDDATTTAIRIFFGRVLKNEVVSTLITKNTVQFEQPLGAPDPALPDRLQAVYLTGCTANTIQLNKNAEDKVTADLGFMPSGHEPFSPIAAPPQLKSELSEAGSGGAPPLVGEDAWATDAHYSYLEIHAVSSSSEAPTPLATDIETMTLSVDNEGQANKALKVRGNCGTSLGSFVVTGTMSLYFETMAAIDAIGDNTDITMGLVMVQGASGAKFGFSMDWPLLSLGNGLPQLELGKKIMLPLDLDAAAGSKVLPTFNHTLMMSYYDYLPDIADVATS
jgi:hypothetical protein